MAKRKPGARLAPAPTAAPIAADNAPEFRIIPLELLLAPRLPSRETLDEDKLADLISSISALGVLEPLCVEPEGEKFMVLAGHRRLIAVQALKMAGVPCMVYPAGRFSGEAIKHHENKLREDLNAAEEAEYFWRLLNSQCNGDVDKLCEMVLERRDYVEGRLALIQGDSRVMEALRRHEINLGVATELNMVKDPATRMMYLDAAAKGGASVRMVRDWRHRGNALADIEPKPPIVETVTDERLKPNVITRSPACYLCHGSEDQHELVILYVHRSCARAVERFQANAVNQAPAPGVTE